MIIRSLQSIRENQEGSLLLMSFLVLGAIVFSSIYLSMIFLQEIRNTRFSDNSLVSYYVAESGAETALMSIKYAKQERTFLDPLDTSDAMQGFSLCGGEGTAKGCLLSSVPENTDPERIFDYKIWGDAEEYVVYDIAQNEPVFFDIFDPSIEGSGFQTNISQINIDWFVDDCTATEASANLEVSYVPISIEDLTLYGAVKPYTLIDVCACNTTAESNGMFLCGYEDGMNDYSVLLPVSQGWFYRMTLRSLNVPVKKIQISTTPALGTGSEIPSQIAVTSVGTYRESESIISLQTSLKEALSGIFNYVVFSEESLIKNVPGELSSPYSSLCGFCSNSTSEQFSRCSTDDDCEEAETCFYINTTIDDIDGHDTAAFCTDSGNSETYVEQASGIAQDDSQTCSAMCNGWTFCGDSMTQNPNGVGGAEECDDGNDNLDDQCDTTNLLGNGLCQFTYCNDGVTQSPNGESEGGPDRDGYEECDDADADSADECDTQGVNNGGVYGSCALTFCGDGVLQNPNGDGARGTGTIAEECDGNQLGGLTCSSFNGFNAGNLSCDAGCMIDTSGCYYAE